MANSFPNHSIITLIFKKKTKPLYYKGVGHLTFEEGGGGRVEKLVSAKSFFSLASVQAMFLELCMHF